MFAFRSPPSAQDETLDNNVRTEARTLSNGINDHENGECGIHDGRADDIIEARATTYISSLRHANSVTDMPLYLSASSVEESGIASRTSQIESTTNRCGSRAHSSTSATLLTASATIEALLHSVVETSRYASLSRSNTESSNRDRLLRSGDIPEELQNFNGIKRKDDHGVGEGIQKEGGGEAGSDGGRKSRIDFREDCHRSCVRKSIGECGSESETQMHRVDDRCILQKVAKPLSQRSSARHTNGGQNIASIHGDGTKNQPDNTLRDAEWTPGQASAAQSVEASTVNRKKVPRVDQDTQRSRVSTSRPTTNQNTDMCRATSFTPTTASRPSTSAGDQTSELEHFVRRSSGGNDSPNAGEAAQAAVREVHTPKSPPLSATVVELKAVRADISVWFEGEVVSCVAANAARAISGGENSAEADAQQPHHHWGKYSKPRLGGSASPRMGDDNTAVDRSGVVADGSSGSQNRATDYAVVISDEDPARRDIHTKGSDTSDDIHGSSRRFCHPARLFRLLWQRDR